MLSQLQFIFLNIVTYSKQIMRPYDLQKKAFDTALKIFSFYYQNQNCNHTYVTEAKWCI